MHDKGDLESRSLGRKRQRLRRAPASVLDLLGVGTLLARAGSVHRGPASEMTTLLCERMSGCTQECASRKLSPRWGHWPRA
jgi:hypothetical protein